MKKIWSSLLTVLMAGFVSCAILDIVNPPDTFKDYSYNIKDMIGYGPVDNWMDLSKDYSKWLDAQVKNGVNVINIELLGWNINASQPNPSYYYQNPSKVKSAYKDLVDGCRKRKIVLLVSIVNDNKGSGKYGDDKKSLADFKVQIRQARDIVFNEGSKGVIVQPVAETGTAEGSKFESETINLCKQKGFLTCWNHGSRPTSSHGCNYFAYHPSSMSNIGASGGITVTDHGNILRELSFNGNVFGPYDPNRVAKYLAKVHGGGRGAIHYGFGDKKVDYNTLNAIGSIKSVVMVNADEINITNSVMDAEYQWRQRDWE